jgi:hypothetical protein
VGAGPWGAGRGKKKVKFVDFTHSGRGDAEETPALGGGGSRGGGGGGAPGRRPPPPRAKPVRGRGQTRPQPRSGGAGGGAKRSRTAGPTGPSVRAKPAQGRRAGGPSTYGDRPAERRK